MCPSKVRFVATSFKTCEMRKILISNPFTVVYCHTGEYVANANQST